jgi:hypothetical protein
MQRPNRLLASVRVFGMSRRAAIEVVVQIQIPDGSRRWVKNLRVIGHWLRKCYLRRWRSDLRVPTTDRTNNSIDVLPPAHLEAVWL